MKFLYTAILALLFYASAGFGVAAGSDLVRVRRFGRNPGNLSMYKYVPADMPPGAPLVVAIHGCTQDAESFDHLAAWSRLADRYKFLVAYPEQKRVNNPRKCFNWFIPGDIRRSEGEAGSIKFMVDKMKKDHSVDEKKVFLAGLSSGGCMTAVMMSVYPDVFSGGAIMSGVPFKCATSPMELFVCMAGVDKTPGDWGNLVRESYKGYKGKYPACSIFHGDSDSTVNVSSARELVEQWTNVHSTDQIPEVDEIFRGHTHRVYQDENGKPVVESYIIKDMPHGIAVDPGDNKDQGGHTGAYSIDRDIWSSYYAARFWGIAE